MCCSYNDVISSLDEPKTYELPGNSLFWSKAVCIHFPNPFFKLLYFPTPNLPIYRSATPPPKTLQYFEGLVMCSLSDHSHFLVCGATVECFHVTPSLFWTQKRTENGHHDGVQGDCSFCGNLGIGRCTCNVFSSVLNGTKYHCCLSENSCLNTYLWCSAIEYCTRCAQRWQLEIRVQ